MAILSIILQVLLGLGFLLFGYKKFTSEEMKQGFKHFGYSDSFRIFTGLFEIISGIVIVVGIWIEPLAPIGGGMVVVTMIGAIMTHIKMKDQLKNMMMPILLLVLGAIVTTLNWSVLF